MNGTYMCNTDNATNHINMSCNSQQSAKRTQMYISTTIVSHGGLSQAYADAPIQATTQAVCGYMDLGGLSHNYKIHKNCKKNMACKPLG